MGSPPGALSGLHILVVEDDRSARTILRDLFEYCGAYVTAAAGERPALAALGHWTPDVVVTDVRLSGHNAPWLLREARARSCNVPFVAVTGYDYDERALRSQGFRAVLRKPLSLNGLVTAVGIATRPR